MITRLVHGWCSPDAPGQRSQPGIWTGGQRPLLNLLIYRDTGKSTRKIFQELPHFWDATNKKKQIQTHCSEQNLSLP